MRVQQILLAQLNAVLRDYRLTFPRYEALMVLLFTREGTLPVGKLGERLQVHRTDVGKLERDGFVRRVPHVTDRRTTLAVITDEGRRVAQATTKDMNAAAFSLGALQPDEQERLTNLLEIVRRCAGDFASPER